MAFGPDGKTVLTGSFDGIARLWDIDKDRAIGPPLRHQHTVSTVAFSPDGRTILTASFDRTALVRESPERPSLSFTHRGSYSLGALQPGRADHPDRQPGRHGSALERGHRRAPRVPLCATGHSVEAIAFSPDGQTVLTGSFDKTARLWNADHRRSPSGAPMRHGDAVKTVAFSPGGDVVVTGSGDKTARLWTAAAGKPVGPPLQHGGLGPAPSRSALTAG